MLLSKQRLSTDSRRRNPSRSTGTRQKSSRRRSAQGMRKPLRFRAARDLSRPRPARTALKPELREGRRNQRPSRFGRPQKRQRLPRNGPSGKSRRPAILEYGPSPISRERPLSSSDPSQKSATLRSDDGRPFVEFHMLGLRG